MSALRVIGIIITLLSACSSGSQARADRELAPPRAQTDGATAALVLPDSPCSTDADCAVVQKGEDCCDICGWRAFTKAGLATLERHCAGRTPSCPAIDCPYQARHAACVERRCTAVPDEPPASAPQPAR